VTDTDRLYADLMNERRRVRRRERYARDPEYRARRLHDRRQRRGNKPAGTRSEAEMCAILLEWML